ncbi:uncharacterized protein [Littorina saxatilis]|uniref:uncharacterized protein n=1 Tax=Littorina saxatilis TaxID=31220 RepID=UPI0038B576D2
MTSNTLPTGSATCLVNHTLPDQNGRYTYRVMFLPGRQFFTAETVHISLPSTPTITCTPAGHETEKSRVTCTCTTGNVGQPAGRLQWLNGSSDVIATGAPGVDRLDMRQTLSPSDDGVTQLRCRLDWSDLPVTSSVYNVSVGLPAPKEPSSGNTAVIGGVVGTVVVAGSIIVVLVVVWKRRKGAIHSRVNRNVEDIAQGKGAEAKVEQSSGQMVTPEGLIYTSVEFAQPPESGKPAPKKSEEEPVVYSSVDFNKHPPPP